MRLNAKRARDLRRACATDKHPRGYVNQSETPSKPAFPGIARLYSLPVYRTRTAMDSMYERRDGHWQRVFVSRTAMNQTGYTGKTPVIPFVMERRIEPDTIDDPKLGEIPNPRAGRVTFGPKLELVPASKPVATTGPKATYRALKRMFKRGLLPATHAEVEGLTEKLNNIGEEKSDGEGDRSVEAA